MSTATHRALPGIAPAMLAGLYQHRLLTTTQLHALYTPQSRLRWTRRVLEGLRARGLVDRVQGPGTLSMWFVTDTGADAVETAGPRAEQRRRVTTPAQAEGLLRAHTIAVNDVGIAFTNAARERGDECGPDSWRHEIAHPISAGSVRKPPQLVVADALLTYLQTTEDGVLVLHQRFIELDRGTARPAEQLATKITRYTRLRYYTPASAVAPDAPAEPLWRRYYRSWPHLLIVLADQSERRIQQRIARTLALYESDPGKDQRIAIPVSFVSLDDLTARGPFAPVFATADQPNQPVNWLGEPRPYDER
jgi:Replication-relaxation